MTRSNSSHNIIGILALILALGALSLQLYTTFIIVPDLTNQVESTTEPSITQTKYVNNSAIIKTNPVLTDISIPDLSIKIDVGKDDSVYIEFSSRVGVWEISGWNYVEVYLAIDNEKIEDAHNKFLINTGSGGSANIVPMTIQYSTSSLSKGEHTITVIIYGANIQNYVNLNTLLVQTYKD